MMQTCRQHLALQSFQNKRPPLRYLSLKASPKTCVKICGLTNVDDARYALECGAELLGMILWPKARRYVPSQTASQISALAKTYRKKADAFPKVVGVFVEETAAEITRVRKQTGIDLVQLHGDAARNALDSLDPAIPKIYVLHADADGRIVTTLETLPAPVDYVLIDGMKGGSGARFALDSLKLPDWVNDSEIVRHGWFLAGGLSPDNVASALVQLERRQMRPIGVDVSSGVCDDSGLTKCHRKIKNFVSRART